MATISSKAFEAYNEDRQLPQQSQTPDHFWEDWYTKGYRQCMKDNAWVNVDDRLPEANEIVLCKIDAPDPMDVSYMCCALFDVLVDDKLFWVTPVHNIAPEIGSFEPTHWKPII